ncbi:MAG: VWA domain-containing protein [Kofleriaceae bacterium]
MTTGMTPGLKVLRAAWPWMLTVVVGLLGGLLMRLHLKSEAGSETIKWRLIDTDGRSWMLLVLVLLAFCGAVGFLAFHLHRRRSAAMGFSHVGLVGARGAGAWLSDVPGVLRVLAIAALGVALARPETYRTVIHETDSVDIMIVFDMSKSMEESDLPRDRMDAAQRVVRRFVRRNKNDRIGLVIFGQQAMMHTPLTADSKVLEQIVADLTIGDVPELGTAIGDGLAMALAQLRRSDGQCVPNAPLTEKTCPETFTCSDKGYCEGEGKHKRSKVVILLSDGDNNWVTRFGPDEAARTAASLGVKVYTVLVGREESDLFGGMSVNPATLKSIAQLTGGEFFRATDLESFDKGFQTVRSKLNATKRVRKERLPDKQLFLPLALVAAILLSLEIILSHTRLRRLP